MESLSHHLSVTGNPSASAINLPLWIAPTTSQRGCGTGILKHSWLKKLTTLGNSIYSCQQIHTSLPTYPTGYPVGYFLRREKYLIGRSQANGNYKRIESVQAFPH